jgi:hypothetical protein
LQVHDVLLAPVRTAPIDGYRRVLAGHLLQDENPSPSCVRVREGSCARQPAVLVCACAGRKPLAFLRARARGFVRAAASRASVRVPVSVCVCVCARARVHAW